MVPETIWPDVRRTHAAHVDAGVRFQRLHAALQAAHRLEFPLSEADLVEKLRMTWTPFTDAAFRDERDYEGLIASIGSEVEHEPAAFAIDLLTVFGRPRYEPYHTLVLGALLDPRRSGALGTRLLEALLDEVAPTCADDHRSELANARVFVERQQQASARAIIPDIVIELGGSPNNAIILIENKVGISDRKGQLDDYRDWVNGIDARRRVLIYLTPHGAPPSAVLDPASQHWLQLSYVTLAVLFRRQLRRANSGPWRDLLGLYLATIVQHILGRRIPARSREERRFFVRYLRAALDDDGHERKLHE